MSTSLAVAINIVLDAGIVIAILSVLGWRIRAQTRDTMHARFVERRRGADRREVDRPVPADAERRRAQRRASGPLTA
jgi:hypothetical protein